MKKKSFIKIDNLFFLIAKKMIFLPCFIGSILLNKGCATDFSSPTPIETSQTQNFISDHHKTSSRKSVKEFEINLPSVIDQANQFAKNGLYREAVVAFKRYLTENPKSEAAHRTLGIIYVKAGSYKNAITHLELAIPAYRDDFELNYYLAEAYRTQNQFLDAIFHYKKALLKDPDNVPSTKALTWSYYSIRYYSEALRSAKILKNLAPDDFQVAIIQARIMNKIGMNERALQALSKAEVLASPGELAFIYSAKGDVLTTMGEHEKAEKFFRKALQDQPLLPGALTGLAKNLMRDPQNYQQAISYLERAVRIKPQHVDALFLLAQAFEDRDLKKSSEYYKRFSKEANLDPTYQRELGYAKAYLAKLTKNQNQEDRSKTKIEGLEDQL